MRRVTHHMACTDTGLKTCDRPAVFTLKPLVRRKRRRVKIRQWRWEVGGEGGGGRKEDVNTDWTQLVHGAIHRWNIPPAYTDNVNRSAGTAPLHRS